MVIRFLDGRTTRPFENRSGSFDQGSGTWPMPLTGKCPLTPPSGWGPCLPAGRKGYNTKRNYPPGKRHPLGWRASLFPPQSARSRREQPMWEELVVHQVNIAICERTLESIVNRRTLHRMVFRAMRLSNKVLFLRCTTSRHPGLRLRGHSESQ